MLVPGPRARLVDMATHTVEMEVPPSRSEAKVSLVGSISKSPSKPKPQKSTSVSDSKPKVVPTVVNPNNSRFITGGVGLVKARSTEDGQSQVNGRGSKDCHTKRKRSKVTAVSVVIDADLDFGDSEENDFKPVVKKLRKNTKKLHVRSECGEKSEGTAERSQPCIIIEDDEDSEFSELKSSAEPGSSRTKQSSPVDDNSKQKPSTSGHNAMATGGCHGDIVRDMNSTADFYKECLSEMDSGEEAYVGDLNSSSRSRNGPVPLDQGESLEQEDLHMLQDFLEDID